LLRLRSDWKVDGKTYPAGMLLAAGFEKYLKGDRTLEALFTPTERKSLAGTSDTKHYLLINELENVRNHLYVLQPQNGRWTRTPFEAPAFGSIGISGIDPDESDDDFIAVAEDLLARKVTTPKHLGIQGGSNGGLLMGVMLTERPDLFKAVVCQVPLLDMRRFNQLLAGASWMDEYGNPDQPEEWAYISKYSPYHNGVKNDVSLGMFSLCFSQTFESVSPP